MPLATAANPAYRTQNSSPAISDDALIGRIRDRDRSAMRLLFVRHRTRVYRFILRITGNAATAEDLTSELFFEVWRNAARFKAQSRVSTWLLAIARYKALSELRRQSRCKGEEDAADMMAPIPPEGEINLMMTERKGLLRQCISQLSTEQRLIIDLVYYHDRSVQEVAEIVGIPASTVKTRMFYARKRIARLLHAAGSARESLFADG